MLAELRAEPFTAQAVGAADRGKQLRVDVGGVPEAERDRRPLDFPLFRDALVQASRGDLPLSPAS